MGDNSKTFDRYVESSRVGVALKSGKTAIRMVW